MNRPKYELIYGQRSGKNLMFLNYVDELESYCDELEKALDKICNVVPNLQWDGCYCCPCCLEKCLKSDSNKNVCDAKDWKEWCLKDE